MRRIKLTAVAAIAIVAAFAVAASSALASPRFYVEGALLGSTEPIEAQANGNQVLTANGVGVECTALSLEGATIFPSNPGSGEETVVYSGCTFEGRTAAECEARTKGGGTAQQVKTVALSSELGYRAATGEETLTLFRPKAGTTFVSIEFKGTNCPLTETKVTGSVAAENDPVQKVNEELTFPAVAINRFFNAAGTETAKPKLTVTGGLPTRYKGRVEVRLTGGNVGLNWGVKE
jgi:hypothetical protein